MDGACAGCVRVGGGWRGVGVDGTIQRDGSGVADIIDIYFFMWTVDSSSCQATIREKYRKARKYRKIR